MRMEKGFSQTKVILVSVMTYYMTSNKPVIESPASRLATSK